jgi:hypothetical protein
LLCDNFLNQLNLKKKKKDEATVEHHPNNDDTTPLQKICRVCRLNRLRHNVYIRCDDATTDERKFPNGILELPLISSFPVTKNNT